MLFWRITNRENTGHRRQRLSFGLGLLVVLLLAGLNSAAQARQPGTDAVSSALPNKITPTLQQQFADQPTGTKLKYWVILADQADTRNTIPTAQWADKGWYVYNTLRARADSTQGPVLAQFETLKKAGKVGDLTSYWIINSIIASGDLVSAQTVAVNPAVAMVKELGTYPLFDTPPSLSDAAVAVYRQARLDSVAQTHWTAPFSIQHNQSEVHAPQAWALGYDGTGITIGSMDTGTRWTHEALNARYRGVVAPPDPGNIHDYNWFDGYNVYTTPTDLNGHGTHTMGTILGTSPNAGYGNIGTARGAMWMTVRICSTNNCDAQAILNGFQWTLAPTRVNGTQANPAYRPRISSNSWGSTACTTPDWQLAVTAWVNAGIFPDFANGNDGPQVGAPASYGNVWGTGALDTSVANWVIANFSNPGPSCFDGSIRPQAIAPGMEIISAWNTSDTTYQPDSGTSMAAPHIAGAVAILQQKNPNLTIAQYMFALTSTAFFDPNWGTRPNNHYGWGLIQIDAALNALGGAQPTPTPSCTSPNYVYAASGGASLVPGTTDIGNHCNDCTTHIQLPFPVKLYQQQYTAANVGSNGLLSVFSTANAANNTCLPDGGSSFPIFAHWDDLRTTASGDGIFTAVTGTAPQRVFNIEWRARRVGTGEIVNFEIRLFENSSRFELVYGRVDGSGGSATVGVQKDFGQRYTLYSCQSPQLYSGLRLSFTLPPCGTADPLP